MRAYIYEQYGGPEVLTLQEIEKPIPKENELLVSVAATSVSTGDARIRQGNPFPIRFINGLLKPKKKVLGMHISGIVEEVGSKVTKFHKGDKIYGSLGMNFGAYAEYACIPEDGHVSLKPEQYSFREAVALIFGATTALHFLAKSHIQTGENVLVNAASGAVGVAAVQIAKYHGATVTGVCSQRNFELVRKLGADHVIDYKSEDFTQNGKTYDVIYDTIGTLHFARVKHSLSKKGRFVTNNAQIRDYLAYVFNRTKIVLGVSSDDGLDKIIRMAEEGKLVSVIDSEYSFGQMRLAHERVDSGRKVGNVVMNIRN
ncbi:MAG: NAD(P)-dependent alcohol dehydrogenase [Candidatus Gracilibacteria bacterium]|nr:NAD(P)-dependent alcohol dehydrogenase [Candidatus Gracilibacteria bacterium]